jgi:F-type H+-transporting ATPase subunit delta
MLGLSSDHTQLEAWGAELERLVKILESPEIAPSFASPEITTTAKIQALARIGEKLDLSFPIRSFATVIARHGRIEDLPAVAERYRQMLDDIMGRTRAILVFSEPPRDDELAQVMAGLEAIVHKKIIPTLKTDPTLLGGVVVELEGKTYDGSLAARLAEAQRRLAGEAR